MITASRLLELQRRTPFQPFTIQTNDGRCVEVKRPENMFVLRSSVIVAKPGEDEFGDRLPLLDVTGLKGSEV